MFYFIGRSKQRPYVRFYMATAAEKIAPFDHTLESDKDAATPTVFRLRPLQAYEYIAAGEIMVTQTRGDAFAYVLRQALLGWTFFADKDGAEIKFSNNQAENIARLNVKQLPELANRVLEVSALDEGERKN